MLIGFKQKTEAYCDRVSEVLIDWLSSADSDVLADRLIEAMRYSLLSGGKRIRPILVYAAADAIAKPSENGENTNSLAKHFADTAAGALECIHAYSLIHDDLPAMDDDDLRRGQATCHVKFDEATAILAGDALQTMAFEKIADLEEASLALQLIKELSFASGANGMVGGQMLDLQAEGQSGHIHLDELERIHRHKTGALIRASVRMGAMSANADDYELTALTRYAEALGLAFQVQDDIIDVCSDTHTLGKPQGADLALGKSTYVSLLGLNNAKEKAQSLIHEAKHALASLSLNDDYLLQLADYVISRDN